MNKIKIMYLTGTCNKQFLYKDNQEIDYTLEERNLIIDHALECDMNILLIKSNDTLIIFVD